MELEHIIRALNRIERLQEAILARLDAGSALQNPETAKWIDSVQVKQILGISESTLYRIRKNKILLPQRIGGRDYFYLPDIFRVKDRYAK